MLLLTQSPRAMALQGEAENRPEVGLRQYGSDPGGRGALCGRAVEGCRLRLTTVRAALAERQLYHLRRLSGFSDLDRRSGLDLTAHQRERDRPVPRGDGDASQLPHAAVP